jgi:hypothetical protein
VRKIQPGRGADQEAHAADQAGAVVKLFLKKEYADRNCVSLTVKEMHG